MTQRSKYESESRTGATSLCSRKNASSTRGRPFQEGNSGRPKGSRNKTTLALEALLDGEADAITRKAVEMALTGDGAASGDITPGEAAELSKLVDGFTKAVELHEIQQRLDKLEAAQGAK